MIPNLDFMRTVLNGICESVFARIRAAVGELERRIEGVDAKIHTPDYEAKAGESGHILNRPFHAEEQVVEILKETTLTDLSSGSGFTYKSLNGVNYGLIAGETYVVIWNGVQYTCTAQAYEDTDAGVAGVVLGETGAWVFGAPAGSGEPFGIACLVEGGAVRTEIISGEKLTTVTLAVRQETEVVAPLDEKYLPGSVFKNGDAGMILTAPGGKRFEITVNDDGALAIEEVAD